MTTTTRRWLLAGGLFIGAGLGLAAYDAATHEASAAPKPGPVVQQGGLLDHRLPAQASLRARQVHQLFTSGRKPCKPRTDTAPATVELPEQAADEVEQRVDPAPAEQPEPETPPAEQPADKPAPAADPITVVPPVVVETPTEPVAETPPVAVDPAPTSDPAPAPDPAVITLPTVGPAPLPDAQVVLPEVTPVLAAVPALPPAAPATDAPTAAKPTVDHHHHVDCDDAPARPVSDLIGQLIASLTDNPTPHADARPGCPTPSQPTGPHTDCMSSTANTGAASTLTLFADLAAALPAPVLARIEHTRARSHLPAGRHIAVEPGPA